MNKSKTQNRVVGRKVLIDWPVRWRDAVPQFRAGLKEEASKGEPYFGATGEVVAYNPGEDRGELAVLLEKSDTTKAEDVGRLVYLYHGAVTFTSEAPNPNGEVEELLRQILATIKENAIKAL